MQLWLLVLVLFYLICCWRCLRFICFCQITVVSPTEWVWQCERLFWVTLGKTSGLPRKSWGQQAGQGRLTSLGFHIGAHRSVSRLRHVDQLRNLAASSTWISINLRKPATKSCVTDRENVLTKQRVPDKEKKSLNPASGAYCKMLIADSQWGEEQKVERVAEGTCRDFGHNLLLNPKESFVQLQLPQVHLASRNTPRQVYDFFLYDLYDFKTVRDALRGAHCGMVTWPNLCTGLVPQAVHSKLHDCWSCSYKCCGHLGWKVRKVAEG